MRAWVTYILVSALLPSFAITAMIYGQAQEARIIGAVGGFSLGAWIGLLPFLLRPLIREARPDA